MSENQRQFSRCPLTDSDSSTVLVVNGRTIPCRLAEISIGGFGVVTRQAVQVDCQDKVLLKTRDLDYIVRVTYQKPGDDGVFVGLKLVEEIPAENTAARWITTAAWAAALSTVAAALYCMSGIHQSLPL